MKDLLAILAEPPSVWRTWQKLPWNDPAFSERMLREHLDPTHDMASRRPEWVARACVWLHEEALGGRPSRVLDLGCGPGLVAAKLAGRGHAVTGIDFSPASIRYAESQNVAGPRPEYWLADMRHAPFGTGYDLALMLFGELDVFPPAEVQAILRKAAAAGNKLVAEVHRPEFLLAGPDSRTWAYGASGLFGDEPHAVLHERHVWAEESALAERWVVVSGGDIAVLKNCTGARSLATWGAWLQAAGWRLVRQGAPLGPEPHFATLLAERIGP